MKVLVTGGSGKIGRALCPKLRESHCVRILSRKFSADSDEEFIRGDIRELDHVSKAMEGVDAVIHLAGVWEPVDSRKIFETNVVGTFNVLESAVIHGVSRVVMASSIGAMGYTSTQSEGLPPIYVPLDEQHPCRPTSMYGVSKLMCEELCKRYTRRHGLSTICLRLVAVTEVEKGIFRPSTDINAGKAILWAYVDIRDTARAFCLALEAEGIEHETFIIAAETHCRKEDSLELIRTYYPEVQQVRNRNAFLLNQRKSFFDTTNAREKLGWIPQFRMEENPSEL